MYFCYALHYTTFIWINQNYKKQKDGVTVFSCRLYYFTVVTCHAYAPAFGMKTSSRLIDTIWIFEKRLDHIQDTRPQYEGVIIEYFHKTKVTLPALKGFRPIYIYGMGIPFAFRQLNFKIGLLCRPRPRPKLHWFMKYGEIPLTSASYLAEIKFYWPLSGVGIPMEQPALRRTLRLLQPTGT